ncbi:hypothetical protein BDP27DRAFT_172292 [Rhodocollybia butyracea]|uniref:Uncharacterized protein n=1 Tax=Rhodocollybia butyracea TaxID=206335 RepID=A0A9P5PIZ7_9AGAR|nr:hypothetical protein BDP27DRAFT_172292 [Rhodocollybia butyracea]
MVTGHITPSNSESRKRLFYRCRPSETSQRSKGESTKMRENRNRHKSRSRSFSCSGYIYTQQVRWGVVIHFGKGKGSSGKLDVPGHSPLDARNT